MYSLYEDRREYSANIPDFVGVTLHSMHKIFPTKMCRQVNPFVYPVFIIRNWVCACPTRRQVSTVMCEWSSKLGSPSECRVSAPFHTPSWRECRRVYDLHRPLCLIEEMFNPQWLPGGRLLVSVDVDSIAASPPPSFTHFVSPSHPLSSAQEPPVRVIHFLLLWLNRTSVSPSLSLCRVEIYNN